MLIWDLRWKPFKTELRSLTEKQRLTLALACIDDTLNDLAPIYESALPSQVCAWINSALTLLWGGPSNSLELKRLVVELETYAQVQLETHANCDHSLSVYDIASAVATLARANGNITAEDASGSMSFSYQAVLDLEIISQLERPTIESEVRKMEETNSRCMTCLNKQLALLDMVVRGMPLRRQAFHWLTQSDGS